jgi:hypothetical protein
LDTVDLPPLTRAEQLLVDLQTRYQDFVTHLPPPLPDLARQSQTFFGPPGKGTFAGVLEKPPAALRLPWLFWDLFACNPDNLFLKVAEGGGCYFLASILLDHLVDGQAQDPGSQALLERALWIHGEACFRAVFPADSVFWEQHDRLLAEHETGLVAERKAQDDPEAFTYTNLVSMASSKICPGLVSLAGLAELSGRTHLLATLETSLKNFAVGAQLIDDVQDWHADLAAGHLTYFLTCTAPLKTWRGRPWHLAATVEANIHATMVDLDHWKLGVERFTRAIQGVQDLVCPGWTDYVYEERRKAHAQWDQAAARHLLRVIETLTVDSSSEAALPPEGSPATASPSPESKPGTPVCRALEALLEAQSPDGSWRDYDIPGLGVSDTWVTAHIGLKLASLPQGYRSFQLKAALDTAADFLAGKWHHGWGYNDNAPVDADTTAHALLFLHKLKRDPPVSTVPALLGFQRTNGGFATYDRFRDLSMPQSWCTAHPDVTPLVVRALLAYQDDPQLDRALAKSIDAAITAALPRLAADRLPDGLWPAFWWVLRWYTTAAWLETYKAMRNLGLGTGGFPQIHWPELSQDFYGCTSRLDEALLLVCALETGRTGLASQAADRLVTAQQPNGLWPIELALCQTTPGIQRPWELATRETLYPENVGLYSTATILHALARWENGSRG